MVLNNHLKTGIILSTRLLNWELLSRVHICITFCQRGELLLLLLYVDDILLAATTNELRDRYYQFISEEYTVKMKPTLDKYLKVELVHHKEEQLVTMSLSGYIRDMAEKFNITPKPHITTPMIPNTVLKTARMVQETAAERDYVRKFPLRELLGVLNYVAITCRPDIQHAVSYLARFTADPANLVCRAVKRVMQYLLNTHDTKLHLGGEVPSLAAMCDSDYGGDVVSYKSTSGHVVYLGNGPVIWYSKQQTIVAQSTAEAEYLALTPTSQSILGIRLLLLEIPYVTIHQHASTTIWDDNAAAIIWSDNPIVNKRTKHIPIKYHYIRDLVEDCIVKCTKIDTKKNCSDLLTKAVAAIIFKTLFPLLMGHVRLPEDLAVKMTNMKSEYLLVNCEY